MSTPRTVKASEVVKGMRIQFDVDLHGVTYTITSSITGEPRKWTETVDIPLGDGGRKVETLPNDHPVTVLAEPEPEWVEGAWYWVSIDGGKPFPLKGERHVDFQGDRLDVLGRVLIVDWPGDDVARDIAQSAVWTNTLASTTRVMHDSIADAIRTQGGVR